MGVKMVELYDCGVHSVSTRGNLVHLFGPVSRNELFRHVTDFLRPPHCNSEMILRNLENYPGVKINGENIINIRYADDTVLIADSEENLQRLLDITIEKSEEMG